MLEKDTFFRADGITLEKYFEARHNSCEKTLAAKYEAINIRFDLVERANTLAREVMTARLENMNRMREQMDKQADTFVDKQTYMDKHDALEERMRRLEESAARIAGMATQEELGGTKLLTYIGIALAIISMILGYFGV
jgi:hypothetical protein